MRGAGQAKRAKRIQPASLAELETIAASVPDRYRLMVLLAAWCALRFGELAELRRSDIDVKNAVVHVRRGVTRTKGGQGGRRPEVGGGEADGRDPAAPDPRSESATSRDHVGTGQDALVFRAATGGHLAPVVAVPGVLPGA